jgi:hypothetical protein
MRAWQHRALPDLHDGELLMTPDSDLERAAFEHCKPLFDAIERLTDPNVRGACESAIVLGFALGAAWATGDKRLMEMAQAQMEQVKASRQ